MTYPWQVVCKVILFITCFDCVVINHLKNKIKKKIDLTILILNLVFQDQHN